jgi:TM2 domain-containing membrane protein YozV
MDEQFQPDFNSQPNDFNTPNEPTQPTPQPQFGEPVQPELKHEPLNPIPTPPVTTVPFDSIKASQTANRVMPVSAPAPDPIPIPTPPPTPTPPPVEPNPQPVTPEPAPRYQPETTQHQPNPTSDNQDFSGFTNTDVEDKKDEADEGSKSFIVAFLLAFFLGFVGADRFYERKFGTAILKLITFGGLGLWTLIDLILILTNHARAKDKTKLKGYKKDRMIAYIIFIAFLILYVSGPILSFLVFGKDLNKLETNACINCSTVNTQTNNNVKTVTLAQAVKGTGDAAGFSVEITKVNTSPAVTGDSPDSGKQYTEVDFSITNNSNSSGMLPGTFYYQTSDGKILSDTSTGGTGSTIDSKNVQLSNTSEQPLIAPVINEGQTNTTYYLLFQVPTGDKGTLVWYDGTVDTTSAKLAIFKLF